MDNNEILCIKCNRKLEEAKAKFNYLNREMHSDVLKCPNCGQVYLSEQLVEDRIRQIESALEDK